jgi:DNA-binding transcriptional MerR regulator
MPKEQTWNISHLAAEFDISPRTIRFYEEKELLAPDRTGGGHRFYTRRDRARLKLILRGKRFGYSLDEIADMIGSATDDIDEKEQIHRTFRYADKSLEEIRRRIEELKMFEAEILEMQKKLETRLQTLKDKELP